MKKDLLKEINHIVWNGKWKGKIDPDALEERIKELLEIEQYFLDLKKRLDAARQLFSYGGND